LLEVLCNREMAQRLPSQRSPRTLERLCDLRSWVFSRNEGPGISWNGSVPIRETTHQHTRVSVWGRMIDMVILTSLGLDLANCTMKDVYDKFSLETSTRDFIGHSMALYQTDDYINQKGTAHDAITRIRLYVNSMARYGKSPYIYPLYGLGELPQGFARLSAIYGGTYMLNTDVDEFLYDGSKVVGIKATMKEKGDDGPGMKFETKCKKIIADPSYFPSKVRVTGHLLKAICILNHPVANTDNSDSFQLIIPQSQVGRKHGTPSVKDDQTQG